VAGQDTDRGEERVFRLSRIDGPVSFCGPRGSVTVPEGTDVRKAVRGWDIKPPPQRTCRLRLRRGAAHGLRRGAISDTTAPGPSGWDLVEVPFSDTGWFADHIASFGADVAVLEPADLRDAVIGRLKGVLA
jgi:proteasome accessory factor B